MKTIDEYLQQFDKSFGLEMQDIQEKNPSWITLGDWIKDFIKQTLTERDAELIAVCKQIYMDTVDWAEWGKDEEDAGKISDEEFSQRATRRVPKEESSHE